MGNTCGRFTSFLDADGHPRLPQPALTLSPFYHETGTTPQAAPPPPAPRRRQRAPVSPVRPTPASQSPAKPRQPRAPAAPAPWRPPPALYSPPLRVLDGMPVTSARVTDTYVLGRELGRGEFGVTFLAVDKRSKERLACKSIPKARLRTRVDVDDVRREVLIMSRLPRHPNLVRLRAAHEDADHVHLVMELCEGGELFDRIVARGRYTERAAAGVARTVAEVVKVCHDSGVMHRDLKPENFLYANIRDDSPLKAIDFGLSVVFTPGQRFTEIVGSPYYMAPEVLRRDYGQECDIWSAGVILYILLCGVPPFWAETEHGVARAILNGTVNFNREPWPKISAGAKDLVAAMLDRVPSRRPTAQQVLEHPWLQSTARGAGDTPLGEIVRRRLKQFSVMNKFKKKAMRVIADHLSMEEIGAIRELFLRIDTGRRGKISFGELKAGLRSMGSKLDDTEIKLMMDAADVDGDGFLDFGEFVAITIHIQRISNDEHLRQAFLFFDKDGSGFIEKQELRDALADESGYADDRVLSSILQEVDADKDGRISYEEFVAMMKAGTDWRKASRQFSREMFASLSKSLLSEGWLFVAGR